MDKAGAYGIQELEDYWVEKIDGCYFNVVGLPISKLDSFIRKAFQYKITIICRILYGRKTYTKASYTIKDPGIK